MSQCLRCSKPCEASAVFCDECRSLLRNEFRRGSASRSSDSNNAAFVSASSPELASFPTSPLSTSAPSLVAQKPEGSGDERADRDTMRPAIAETPRVSNAPITPHPPTMNDYTHLDSADQTMSRLSEAAQLIAEAEPSNRRLPRASRLAPIRDISADIRRESTPLPKFAKMRGNTDASEKTGDSGPLPSQQNHAPERDHFEDGELPDLWPWLDSEVEEKENEDSWANSTDPLISRHIPNSVEAARIEEEDIKRALAEGMPTSHDLRLVRPRRAFSLRIVFAVLALLAVAALIVDSVLLSVVVSHPRRAATTPNGPAVPTLTLSSNVAIIVSIVDGVKKNIVVPVQVHIRNFPRYDNIQLTHDVQEAVTTTNPGGSSIVTTRKDGSADVTLKVDDSWAVGFDQVYAEDVATHYTASAQLQVKGASPSSPAHLDLLDQHGNLVNSLNFGSVVLGTNSILPLTLKNSGSGSITWSAGSDQPWLLVSPNQGIFSQSQKIDVAVQTLNLKVGKQYTAILTLSSNVSAGPQAIKVTLIVSQPNQGAVLAPTPAVLSFTTTDGSPAPPVQVLTLNNPGNKALNWTLGVTSSLAASNQSALARVPGITNNWLSASPASGSVPADSSQQILVSVNSDKLLPGAYQGELLFSAPGAVDTTQTVAVSLTVQPHCGLVTNAGYLTFTAVFGKTNPGNQSLGLNATASCASEPQPLNWKATLSSWYSWLSATPTSGTLTGTTSEFVSVGADAEGLPANVYYGFIAFTTPHSTQTVMVQLTVQPPPLPGAPIMNAAPLNLNFSSTQGQPNPQGQVVTITNSGGSPLKWSTNVTIIATSWLNAAPSGGTVMPGQTGQLVVNVDISKLPSPGSYAGQITLNAQAPASGGGEVISVNLVVQPPCTLTQPSSSSLAFSGVQGGADPIAPTLLITGTGNCAWPLTLTASTPSASWLKVQFSPVNKINANGQSIAFVVGVSMTGLTSGQPISASFTISATDSAGTVAKGSPQQITATLSVLPPCLPAPVTNLTFTAVQGQASPAPQSVPLSESGTCSRPVTWTATNVNNSAWLSLSSIPSDTGNGTSLGVTVNNGSLAAGTYTGTINLTALDNNNNAVGGLETVTVTLTVTPPPTYTVSGTVMACAGPAPSCPAPVPLPLATLTLYNSANVEVATTTADASGNYSFTGLPAGSYTVTISGIDSNNVQYLSTDPLSVTANATSVTLQVFPG